MYTKIFKIIKINKFLNKNISYYNTIGKSIGYEEYQIKNLQKEFLSSKFNYNNRM